MTGCPILDAILRQGRDTKNSTSPPASSHRVAAQTPAPAPKSFDPNNQPPRPPSDPAPGKPPAIQTSCGLQPPPRPPQVPAPAAKPRSGHWLLPDARDV